MAILIDWEKHIVKQRDKDLGCIPTSYEWLIRMSGDCRVDFTGFQEEFNLERRSVAPNNFISVGNAIESRFPFFHFRQEVFTDGKEKAKFLQEMILNQIPILVSLINQPANRGFHIMPVIEIDLSTDKILMVNGVTNKGIVLFHDVKSVDEFVNRHNRFQGGRDVAWLDMID